MMMGWMGLWLEVLHGIAVVKCGFSCITFMPDNGLGFSSFVPCSLGYISAILASIFLLFFSNFPRESESRNEPKTADLFILFLFLLFTKYYMRGVQRRDDDPAAPPLDVPWSE
jgi:hypothetical protein